MGDKWGKPQYIQELQETKQLNSNKTKYKKLRN